MLSSLFSWQRYGSSLGLTILAGAATLVTWPLSQHFPFALVLAAVVASAG